MRSRGLGDGLERLSKTSGLLRLGFSRDARAARLARPSAALAVDRRSRRCAHISDDRGAGGIDTLVFTGGIGGRSQVLRDEICGPRLPR
jgi:acetate kinase